MDNKLLLAKSITLLLRESQLTDSSDSSADLVRTVLENVQVSEISVGMSSDRDVILALKTTALEMCGHPQDHTYDLQELLQRVRINCAGDDRLYEGIRQGIEEETSEASLRRMILNIRKAINNHFREQKIDLILNKAAGDVRFRRDKIKDMSQFIAEVVTQLEPLQNVASAKDVAVMGELDLADESSTQSIFEAAKQMTSGKRVYRFGWQDLNDMTQGGGRPGETIVVGALQHKYKTGFTLSLFGQVALFNRPLSNALVEGKKPLLLRISFEDELVNNLQFIYQYLKYNETRQIVDIDKDGTTIEEMSSYVKEKLQVNGFHVKMMRVDPSGWTYRSILNKIIELEAQGYVIEVLMVDYLSKLPTTGCINTGPMGSDHMDMLNRMRNFCAAKQIMFLTPHQFSTEAKNLLRGGVPDEYFTREVAEKGYWEFTKGLDRIFDLGLLIHIVKHNKKWYLSVARDKHRLPTILDDEKRHFLLPFPFKMPIPHDVDGEKISMRRLPSGRDEDSDGLFDNM